MRKVLVIGRGPAGISASLYIRRGGFEVTVAAKDDGALARAEKVENFYGQAEPVSGSEIIRRGIAGAKRLGVNFREAEVVALTTEEKGFSAKTAVGETLAADAVVLAAGASRSAPPIPGLKDFPGRGVSYCAVCDGVFYRGKTVAVLGAGEFAQHEADILSLTAKKVILLTHGQAAPVVDSRYEVHTAPVEAVTGDTRVRGVRLSDGSDVASPGERREALIWRAALARSSRTPISVSTRTWPRTCRAFMLRETAPAACFRSSKRLTTAR